MYLKLGNEQPAAELYINGRRTLVAHHEPSETVVIFEDGLSHGQAMKDTITIVKALFIEGTQPTYIDGDNPGLVGLLHTHFNLGARP